MPSSSRGAKKSRVSLRHVPRCSQSASTGSRSIRTTQREPRPSGSGSAKRSSAAERESSPDAGSSTPLPSSDVARASPGSAEMATSTLTCSSGTTPAMATANRHSSSAMQAASSPSWDPGSGLGRPIRTAPAGRSRPRAHADTAAAVALHTPIIRNKLLLLFGQQTSQQLIGRNGKEQLQALALAEVKKTLKAQHAANQVDALLPLRPLAAELGDLTAQFELFEVDGASVHFDRRDGLLRCRLPARPLAPPSPSTVIGAS